MRVLGIETSCDETAAAVVVAGRGESVRIASSVIASQADLHAPYGGIVPEIAARRQLELIEPVVVECLQRAELTLGQIEAVAVTQRPGLLGALLVGVHYAKGLSFALGVPIVGVSHLEAHLYAVHLEHPVAFPHLALLVSGGHTLLARVRGPGSVECLGETRDDAAGEAFDKVAQLLDLGYPGGPAIDRLAARGDPGSFRFPRGLKGRGLDFSFSGLKTAVAVLLREQGGARFLHRHQADLAASFQEAVVESLVEKALAAARKTSLDRIVVCGGVAANSRLRKVLADRAEGRTVDFPSRHLCTDNAAMVAGLGYELLVRRGPDDRFALDASAVVERFPRFEG